MLQFTLKYVYHIFRLGVILSLNLKFYIMRSIMTKLYCWQWRFTQNNFVKILLKPKINGVFQCLHLQRRLKTN